MCESVLRFRPFLLELWGKRVFFKSGTYSFFLRWGKCKNFLQGHFFEAMVLKLCTGYLAHITEYVWKFFCDFAHSGPNYGDKGVFSKVGLSHFFLCWGKCKNFLHGHFFEAMVLKLFTGYLVHITEYVWFFFGDYTHSGPNYGEKRGFFKSGT